jgi:hypothetical protein
MGAVARPWWCPVFLPKKTKQPPNKRGGRGWGWFGMLIKNTRAGFTLTLVILSTSYEKRNDYCKALTVCLLQM